MSVRVKGRHQYDDEADKVAREATDICCKDDVLVQQSFAADADINVLVQRFGLVDAPMPAAAPDASFYGDVREVPDLRTVLDIGRRARDAFMSLDPKIRAHFGNDMVRLHEFVSDDSNRAVAEAMGLLAPVEPVVPPVVVPEPVAAVVPPVAP